MTLYGNKLLTPHDCFIIYSDIYMGWCIFKYNKHKSTKSVFNGQIWSNISGNISLTTKGLPQVISFFAELSVIDF